MYNGVGLQSSRGSGTNGHVQFNKFIAKPNTNKIVVESGRGSTGLIRKPEKEMSEHNRKRRIELKLLELEEKLIDEGYTVDEIAEKLDTARKSLFNEN